MSEGSRSPYDVTRDVQWRAAFRESLLEAMGDGDDLRWSLEETRRLLRAPGGFRQLAMDVAAGRRTLPRRRRWWRAVRRAWRWLFWTGG